MMQERKLSPEDREEIIRQLQSPTKKPRGFETILAQQFGVSRQRISQLKWSTARLHQPVEEEHTGPIPYRTLGESPIQVGDYCIEVFRLYRNDGDGSSYLSPKLERCVLRHFHDGKEFKWKTFPTYDPLWS